MPCVGKPALPKTLYHLTKTVLFLAGHITHSEYQRYLALNARVKDEGEARFFKSGSSTSRAHKSHQTHAEHFLGTHFPMSYLPQCSREHSSLKLEVKLEVEESSMDILSVD